MAVVCAEQKSERYGHKESRDYSSADALAVHIVKIPSNADALRSSFYEKTDRDTGMSQPPLGMVMPTSAPCNILIGRQAYVK